MKVEITKQLVLDAIENENIELLNPGRWIDIRSSRELRIRPENCSRCMVGCVLSKVVTEFRMIHRAATASTLGGGRISPNTEEHHSYEYNLDNVRAIALESVSAGYPMTGLSYFFEGTCLVYTHNSREYIDNLPRPMIAEIRELTLKFVREYFPETMVIDINGAEPVEGVRVVQS